MKSGTLAASLALLHIFLAVHADAVQLWPDITLSLSATDKPLDRGLVLSGDPGYGGSVLFAFDRLDISMDGLKCDDNSSRSIDTQLGCDVQFLVYEGGLGIRLGYAGERFEYSGTGMDYQRNEIRVSAATEVKRLGGAVVTGNVMSDISNEFAVYAGLAVSRTVTVSSWLDVEFSADIGCGDKAFTEQHLAALAYDSDLPQYWADASASVAVPIMFGWGDVVPRVSHSWVLSRDSRRAIEESSVDSDNWAVSLAVRFYLE